jgi:hypothetical protein
MAALVTGPIAVCSERGSYRGRMLGGDRVLRFDVSAAVHDRGMVID